MATDWTTIVNTTTSRYLKEVEVNILRQRRLLAMLKSKGRITYGEGGRKLDWKVKYKRAPLMGYADGDTITFARRDRHKTAEMDWRSYNLTDMVSKMDRLKNKGPAQIINIFAGIAESMMEDIEENFCDELYGNGSSNTRKLHGLETFTGDGGAISGSVVRSPSSTYAGISCVPGAYGGSWTGTWPDGYGDAHYDFWSPILVDYGSSNWGGSGQTWSKNGFDAVRYALMKARRSKSMKGAPDLVLMTDEMYRTLLSVMDDKEQINVTRGADSGKVALGFPASVVFDGVELFWEFGTPASTAYVFNTNQMELVSMQPKLFEVTGPELEMSTQSYRFMVDFYGNVKYNPRSFAKLYQYTGP